ncbi:hypothetical protein LIER_17568 [Lithospermum erythrorhizon]|uniref:BSD domain-containing protein n=1 Tax=Lithospermum erythrorhizon TaxID=34254 RepID=A0AAV3QD68_LITER
MSWLGGSLGQQNEEEIDLGHDQRRGIEEDLSEFAQTLTSQFWAVASISINRKEDYCKKDDFDDNKEDLGSFYDDAVGVTDEALAFAHNIAHHPETWLDFPIEEDEEEAFQDFRISDSQYKHALAIERCVPSLAALRIELCPVHMSEGYFWMVYFVLLHSRLNKNDADQLSSAELVQARSMWREELKKKAKPETDWFGRSTFYSPSTLSPRENLDHDILEDSETRQLSFNSYNAGSRTYHPSTYNETEKQIVECDEAKSADTPSGNSERDFLTFQSSQIIQDDNVDGEDDWLQDTADLDGYLTTGIVVNEEDVSFSDLEEDSDWTMPIRSK